MVKFVGDEAMIVAPTAPLLARIMVELVMGESAIGPGLAWHAGLASGEVLTLDGDYFGSVVNVAARLVALAGPGTILATQPVGIALEAAGWTVTWNQPQPIRGLQDAIVTCAVSSLPPASD